MKSQQKKKVVKVVIRICSALFGWTTGILFFMVPLSWSLVLCLSVHTYFPTWLIVLTMCMGGILGILAGVGMGKMVKDEVEDSLREFFWKRNIVVYL